MEKDRTGKYILSQDESERIYIMKIWMSIMIVLTHSYMDGKFYFDGANILLTVPSWLDWVKYIISTVISGCAVPGFFFFSAILLYKNDFVWRTNLQKKIHTLIIPYLIVNTFWIGFYFVMEHIDLLSGYFNPVGPNMVVSWTWKDWIGAYTGIGRTPHFVPICGPMWFLRDLFLLNTMASALKGWIDRMPKIMFLFLLAMTPLAGEWFPLMRQYSLLFFCMGYYVVKYDIHFADIDKSSQIVLASIYIATIILCCLTRNGFMEMIFRGICVFVGIIFFITCSGRINNVLKKFFLRIARYSMPIYLFHGVTIGMMQEVAIKFLPQTALVQTLEYFGLAIGIIGLIVLGSLLFRCIAPRIYAIVTGDRT